MKVSEVAFAWKMTHRGEAKIRTTCDTTQTRKYKSKKMKNVETKLDELKFSLFLMKNNKKPNKNWNYVFDIIEFVILMRDEMCDFQNWTLSKALVVSLLKKSIRSITVFLKKLWSHRFLIKKVSQPALRLNISDLM